MYIVHLRRDKVNFDDLTQGRFYEDRGGSQSSRILLKIITYISLTPNDKMKILLKIHDQFPHHKKNITYICI